MHDYEFCAFHQLSKLTRWIYHAFACCLFVVSESFIRRPDWYTALPKLGTNSDKRQSVSVKSHFVNCMIMLHNVFQSAFSRAGFFLVLIRSQMLILPTYARKLICSLMLSNRCFNKLTMYTWGIPYSNIR